MTNVTLAPYTLGIDAVTAFIQNLPVHMSNIVHVYDVGPTTKSPRLGCIAFRQVKGHMWNYCAEGQRTWERGYDHIDITTQVKS